MNNKCGVRSAECGVLAVALMLFFGAWTASAQLTATVTPGYTFQSGEVPTTTKMNLLGLPTITISGTVSGSTGLSTNSVNGSQLVNNLPDGVTLDYYTVPNPRQLEVKTAGIYYTQLNVTAFGFGLRGAQTAPVFVYAGDFLTNTIFHTNASGIVDSLLSNSVSGASLTGPSNTVFGVAYSGTNVFGTNLNLGPGLAVSAAASLVITGFVSTNIVLPANFSGGVQIANLAHGLSNAPRTLRWVLQCQTAELGYSVGDEVDVGSFDRNQGTAFSYGSSSTNVWLVASPGGAVAGSSTLLNPKGGGALAVLTLNRWQAKCYAFP